MKKTTGIEMKNNLVLILPTLLVLSLLSACGSSKSDPLDKYKDIKAVPANNEKAQTQKVARPDLFSIEVEGTNEVNLGNFVEGQPSTVLVRITPKTASIQKFSVRLSDFTNSSRPELTGTPAPGVFALTWTAALGTIPAGQFAMQFKAEIEATVVGSANPRLNGISNSKSINVTVSRNSSQPKITGRSSLTKGVDEGQALPFTIDVTDPASLNHVSLPEMQITPYVNSNTESYHADGSSYLVYDDRRKENPEKLSPTTYRFHYILKVDQLPLDRDRQGKDIAAAADVDMCFQMRAISAVGTMSDQLQVCTKARYAAQPPMIAFDSQLPNEFKAGQAVTIQLKVATEHPKSVINISKPNALIASLSGQKEIACAVEVADKKNSQICVIKWTPACTDKNVTMNIPVKAESSLGGKIKSITVVKSVTVVPGEECVVVPAIKKPAPVKKGSK
ncbi:MAG: hypothetical protein H7061_02010 [Bdellovibrionaceae bacterium]|nr:hypothetical protein [Bdellovibrio sp.]